MILVTHGTALTDASSDCVSYWDYNDSGKSMGQFKHHIVEFLSGSTASRIALAKDSHVCTSKFKEVRATI